MNGPDFSVLAETFPKAETFVCFIHPQATYDAVAAATSLQAALTQSGKSCSVVCDEPMRVEYNYLLGVDKIKQKVGNRDLVVSFAYDEQSVDEVSYHINKEEGRFELVIQPKKGAPTLDPNTIDVKQAGLSADVIFLFGYHSFDELGEVYNKEKYAINHSFSVAVTRSEINPFAKLHLTLQPEDFSYSELIYFLIRQLQIVEIKDDLATNLLGGIEYASQQFADSRLPARVFETVANLMRRGGQRQADNPAFDNLNAPIRQPNPEVRPTQVGNSLPAGLNQGIPPAGGPAPVQAQSVMPQTQAIPAQPASSPQSVSANSSDLAQAMSGKIKPTA